ncbi:MAG: double-strand break repair protein AddB [Inquilinus sp.]|nr:double-strand break repair protein AddB [Inquilinus sp.]
MSAGPTLYTIPPGTPFVDALAVGILERAGDDPLALGRVTILLPTRRACRSLREAFLRLAPGDPPALLLPRMAPLGDIDPEALELEVEDLPGLADALDLPSAISELRRRILLARLVLGRRDLPATPDQAAWLAAELGRLIDQVTTERLDFADLAGLVPVELAEHWQQTLAFLEIVTARWPEILAAEGAIDAAERRNRILDSRAEAWRRRPPADPVIAAGSTGTVPATAGLLEVVARLPVGALVLPGLDREMDGESWDAVDETHPQAGMKRLLERIGVDHRAVPDWPAAAKAGGSPPGRARLVGEIMRPAATSEAWRGLAPVDEAALTGITCIDCPTPREEATVIALLMREALETPGRTAALVTPDRGLARRVAAAHARWGLAVDDSGGRPLADTPAGLFLRLVAQAAADGLAPLALLAVLKHPLAAGGEAAAGFRARVRALERAALRGPRPASGAAGLVAALQAADEKRFDRPAERAALVEWVGRLAACFAPLARLAEGEAALGDLLAAHMAVAEALAATADEPGAARLWRHDDGEAAAGFAAELAEAAADFPALPLVRYPGLIEALMAGRVVRPRYGEHPRLSIWGPLEARLQSADLLILGGLNEGTWPADPAVDPWLSRPMRVQFGLPAPERRIGLAAHDVTQALAAPRVVLTRSERVEGAPTVPSRWLSRLAAVIGEDAMAALNGDGAPWRHWTVALDRPDAVRPCPPPAPRPPVAARPRRLSVTGVGTWMTNPYAIYARHILRLEPLEAIEADPGAAERGEVIHNALSAFVATDGGGLTDDALARLLAEGRVAFAALAAYPEAGAFWWPRFERIAAWFVGHEAERRAVAMPAATECKGRLSFDGPAGEFTLTARADRIDKRADGTLAIIDYKTGAVPTDKQIAAGYAPQLPLEALIAAAAGFEGVAAAAVAELAHWRLSGGDPAGEEKPVRIVLDDLIRQTETGLRRLIARFDDPDTPYLARPRPDFIYRFDDYEHLARVLEWSAGGGEAP